MLEEVVLLRSFARKGSGYGGLIPCRLFRPRPCIKKDLTGVPVDRRLLFYATSLNGPEAYGALVGMHCGNRLNRMCPMYHLPGEIAVAFWPVETCVRVTLAPGTAESEGSTTEPLMIPTMFWAAAGKANTAINRDLKPTLAKGCREFFI